MADIKLTMFFKKIQNSYTIMCIQSNCLCLYSARTYPNLCVFVWVIILVFTWMVFMQGDCYFFTASGIQHHTLYYIAINFCLLLRRCHTGLPLHKQGYRPWELLHLLPYHWQRTSWSESGMDSFWKTCVTLSAINYTYVIEWHPTSSLQLAVPYKGLTAVTLTYQHTHYPRL